MTVSEILMAMWCENPNREIVSITNEGIVFGDTGEVTSLEQGIKRYKAEILGEYYASDPDTYPDFVRNAFGYFDEFRRKNPQENVDAIARIAARCYAESKEQYEFILDCFCVSYPEFKGQEFMIRKYEASV